MIIEFFDNWIFLDNKQYKKCFESNMNNQKLKKLEMSYQMHIEHCYGKNTITAHEKLLKSLTTTLPMLLKMKSRTLSIPINTFMSS